MRTLYVSAFLKLTLEKFLQFKLLPKIGDQPNPDMRVSPRRTTCDRREYHTYEKAFVKEEIILNLIPGRR